MAGQRKKRNVMAAFKMDEISCVDRPAQPGAVLSIMKRAPDSQKDDDKFSKVGEWIAKNAALTTSIEGHSHLVMLSGYNGEFDSGETSYQEGHSHPWVRLPDGSIEIGEAQGHTHRVSTIGKSQSKGAKNMADSSTPTKKSAGNGNGEDKTQEQLDALQKQLDRANAVLKMDSEERTYFDSLDEAGQTDYLGKSAEARKSAIAKAREGNAVVYTARDGTEYTKKDDERLVKMARQADEANERMEKAENASKEADLRKRASELAHIPGTEDDRVAMLKAIDGIADEAARKRAEEALKAQNTALAAAFKSAGVSGVGTGAESGEESDEEQLEKMAKKYAEDNKVSFEKAYAEVLNSEEGQALYAKAYS